MVVGVSHGRPTALQLFRALEFLREIWGAMAEQESGFTTEGKRRRSIHTAALSSVLVLRVVFGILAHYHIADVSHPRWARNGTSCWSEFVL